MVIEGPVRGAATTTSDSSSTAAQRLALDTFASTQDECCGCVRQYSSKDAKSTVQAVHQPILSCGNNFATDILKCCRCNCLRPATGTGQCTSVAVSLSGCTSPVTRASCSATLLRSRFIVAVEWPATLESATECFKLTNCTIRTCTQGNQCKIYAYINSHLASC